MGLLALGCHQHLPKRPGAKFILFDFLFLLVGESGLFGGGHFYLLLEFVDSADGVDELLLAGVKGMAIRAQLDSDLLFRRAGCKRVPAGTNYLGIREISRMYTLFHSLIISYL